MIINVKEEKLTNYKFIPQLTADGSWTFFSPEFGETFHSYFGAQQEAKYKFVYPVQLLSRIDRSVVYILCLLYTSDAADE